MNQSLGIFIFIGMLAFVLILSFSLRLVITKRQKASAQERIQKVNEQLEFVKNTYIKDPSVKLAYVYSNANMCRNTNEKAKEAAKNVAKAVIRTSLSGRASYKGSDINSRDYVIGYGNQMLYFFQALSSTTARTLTYCEDGFFTIKKEELKSIKIKNKKNPVITFILQDGSQIGVEIKNNIIQEYSFKEENEMFVDDMKKEASRMESAA